MDFSAYPLLADTIVVPTPPVTPWPSAQVYNQYWPEPFVHQGNTLRFVEQTACTHFETDIYKYGAISTRSMWHDYFNNTSWLQFPRIKSAINTLYVEEGSSGSRTPKQNALALFDENGVVVFAAKAVLEAIQNHDWQKVFTSEFQCWVIGHSIWEKALNPYLAMTSHAILIEGQPCDYRACDAQVAAILPLVTQARLLQPFPLMGVRNWFAAPLAQRLSNTHVFRATTRMRGHIHKPNS